ncbi:MAG: zinc-finger domain-containing protein [Gammaproteobacteria bacterium]|nr:zinc-finger domain-containing protein [Gammaproteobacteria bacterium]
MSNVQRTHSVTHEDLPLSCPMPEMQLWNSHPRVFLSIQSEGEVKCPYCGTEYILVGKGL